MRIREISEYGLERRDSKDSEKDKEKSEKSRYKCLKMYLNVQELKVNVTNLV
jgi:hypothetical protein